MGRPKGSTNKKKEEVKVFPKPSEVKKEVYVCVSCTHGREKHYGSIKEWCNERGCNCQEWKS